MSIKLRWLGFACFEIVLPSGKVLVTDPYIDYSPTAPVKCQDVTGADYIAITHGHFDHITDVGPLVQRFDSKVLCSHQLAEPLASFFGFDPGNIVRVRAGDTVVFDDLKVEVKMSEHPGTVPSLRRLYRDMTGTELSPGMSIAELRATVQPMLTRVLNPENLKMIQSMTAAGIPANSAGEMLNFVFETSDNLRIHMLGAGPYEFLRHEIASARPNIAIVQLAPNDPEEMAELAALSRAEVIIPYHHDSRLDETHNEARKMAQHLAAKSKAHFLDIVHGKWYELEVKVSAI